MKGTKCCFKCHKEKPLSDFYKHREMSDGHLNKCKTCTKRDVSRNYRKNIEHYTTYERSRSQNPQRKINQLRYKQEGRKRNRIQYKA